MLALQSKATNKVLQLSLVLLIIAALASYWAVCTVTQSKLTSLIALFVCMSAIALGLFGVKMGMDITHNPVKVDLKANEYLTTYSRKGGYWHGDTVWVDTNGQPNVLSTFKNGDYVITALNERKIFIHGTSAAYKDIRKNHHRLKQHLAKQGVNSNLQF